MTDKSGYLARLEARTALMDLKRHIVFGLFVSLVAVILGGVNYLLIKGATDWLWRAVMWAGVAGLAVTLFLPSLWGGPERVFRSLASSLGELIFKLFLTIIYVLFFWPAGIVMRAFEEPVPIYQWETESPPGMEGWKEKKTTVMSAEKHETRAHLLLQPFAVVGFFVKNGKFLVLPVIVILLAMGLVLFFVQTSALAPFIYTLF